MLVAAVQLELFQMLDDICEAGDVENELFDDLCCDTIQEGARTGFVHLTAELLLSPGSGYKRLLQIRKDQVCSPPPFRLRLRLLATRALGSSCTILRGKPLESRDSLLKFLNRLKFMSSADAERGGTRDVEIHLVEVLMVFCASNSIQGRGWSGRYSEVIPRTRTMLLLS